MKYTCSAQTEDSTFNINNNTYRNNKNNCFCRAIPTQAFAVVLFNGINSLSLSVRSAVCGVRCTTAQNPQPTYTTDTSVAVAVAYRI